MMLPSNDLRSQEFERTDRHNKCFQRNHSNIEREALATVTVVTRLKKFLLGRKLNLQTDHKPLQYLFAPYGEIPKKATARKIIRAIALIRFDYKLKYVPGEQIPHADALTRLRFEDEKPEEKKLFFRMTSFSQIIKLYYIKSDLKSNRTLQDVFKRIRSGDWRQCLEAESHFKKEA